MVGSVVQNRQRLGRALLVASIVAISTVAARADRTPGFPEPIDPDRERVVKREAPVFTYRQFTSQLPSLPSSPVDDDSPEAFNLPTPPTFPPSVPPAGQGQAGLMGRFGQAVDAGSAQDGLSGAHAEPSASSEPEPAELEPATTAAAAEPPATPEAPADRDASAAKARLLGSGRASWYKHPGRTASGEIYDPDKLTAAHHTLPFGTRVKVVNTDNGRSVVVQITDRTNERTKAKRNYTIDLSRASARRIGIEGIGQVALYTVD